MLERQENQQWLISLFARGGPWRQAKGENFGGEHLHRWFLELTRTRELEFPERRLKRDTSPINHILWNYEWGARDLKRTVEESIARRDWVLGM